MGPSCSVFIAKLIIIARKYRLTNQYIKHHNCLDKPDITIMPKYLKVKSKSQFLTRKNELFQ